MSRITAGQVRSAGAELPLHREVAAVASCRDLLQQFADAPAALGGGKIRFGGVGANDVYNITAPFEFDGQTLIAGRVESRDSERSTTVLFRHETDGTTNGDVGAGIWKPCPGAPAFTGLQDPCVTRVNGELVLGGVRFPLKLNNGDTGWRMEFFRGTRLCNLEQFLLGPDHMKDIRFAALADGRVAVFSRPQGEKGGRGKIGFTVADSLDAITADTIEQAPLFPGQFRDSEWGAANEVHLLRNGKLGVLGHIACMDEREHRHYYAMAFAVDPASRTAGPLRIIASRDQFPAGPAKRQDLIDVIFAGGMLRHGDGTATLFAGISDVEAGFVKVPDPMLAFEQ